MKSNESLTFKQIRQLFSRTYDAIGGAPRNPLGRPGAPIGLAGRLEHTLLAADATVDQLGRLCEEAVAAGLCAVCCNPGDVAYCVSRLRGTSVFVVSVVDFPLGRGTTGDACFQCAGAVKSGAGEVDMVVDVGAIKSGKPAAAMEKIRAVTEAAAGAPVKVILETGLLSEPQIVEACAAAAVAGAAYVKTSTGFGPRGASLRDVEIMRAAVGETMGIKAAGGIRDRETCLKMVAAGADRIGTSVGPACVLELPKR